MSSVSSVKDGDIVIISVHRNLQCSMMVISAMEISICAKENEDSSKWNINAV